MKNKHTSKYTCGSCGKPFLNHHGLMIHKGRVHKDMLEKKKEEAEYNKPNDSLVGHPGVIQCERCHRLFIRSGVALLDVSEGREPLCGLCPRRIVVSDSVFSIKTRKKRRKLKPKLNKKKRRR